MAKRTTQKKEASEICKQFGAKIKRLRKKSNWTQMYLSVHTGLSRTFISDVENAIKEPCLDSIKTLADAFGLSVSQLTRGL
jgi:transcriptional regulator with XRE-family HTH domain